MKCIGAHFRRIMTDNARNYRDSRLFQATLAEIGARHLLTPAYHPQVNGKVERFNRTLLQEWPYVRSYQDNEERVALLVPLDKGSQADWSHYLDERAAGGPCCTWRTKMEWHLDSQPAVR